MRFLFFFFSALIGFGPLSFGAANLRAKVDSEVVRIFGDTARYEVPANDCASCHSPTLLPSLATVNSTFGSTFRSKRQSLFSTTPIVDLSLAQVNQILNSLAGEDSDGDGFSNEQEFVAGSDVSLSSSVPGQPAPSPTPDQGALGFEEEFAEDDVLSGGCGAQSGLEASGFGWVVFLAPLALVAYLRRRE